MCHSHGPDEPHDHHHGHGHTHSHGHAHGTDELDPDTAVALDTSIADGELSPSQLSRRSLFRSAGIVSGATALGMVGVTPAMAEGRGRPATAPATGGGPVWHWLAGDHHIHTQFSSDAMYRVIDQVQHGAAYGLDWMVITDHGGATHARIGVELVNPESARPASCSPTPWSSRAWSGTSRPPSTARCSSRRVRTRCRFSSSSKPTTTAA